MNPVRMDCDAALADLPPVVGFPCDFPAQMNLVLTTLFRDAALGITASCQLTN